MPHTSPSRTRKAKPGSLGGVCSKLLSRWLFVVKIARFGALFLEFVRGELLEGISSLQSLPVGEACGFDLDQIGP